ncbi:TPM domain-containing protein [Tepidibacter formicigenes]|jgi:uncharacterized protein|uniref:TPM domain-containing protein n=1 Tax=Tepidibacter formicigenes DSM 15518 TaxID=1123349 RepID=A0A1M6LJU5_9FIRM|nr:TPM domain-containing protein [Tepidibacter formicigenes]SHJ71476.1 uncharacterized protein SAMN02744037_00661 [Tepidibacter formicigenes DSM 15518]
MKRNRLLLYFIAFLLLLTNTLSVFASEDFPKPTQAFYVADYGKVLSEEFKSFIVNTNLNYENTKEKPQVVVATIKSLEGMDVSSYAVNLFEKWQIGNKDLDNGILILLSLKEEKIRVEVGYGLEGALPDGKVGEILDHATEDLSLGNFDEGIGKIFYTISQSINQEYDYDDRVIFSRSSNFVIKNETTKTKEKNISLITKIFIVIVIFILGWLDYRFTEGFFIGMLINMLLRGNFENGGQYGNSGMGGNSGGGGSDRDF